MEFGVVSRPHPAYEVNGDAHMVERRDNFILVSIVDGLGHGPDAAKASRRAIEVLAGNDWGNVADLLRKCHYALQPTRGAAMALARIDLNQARLTYCGVGNIEARLIGRTSSRPISYNGIVGSILPHFQVFEYSFQPGDLVLMHSDGISARFDLKQYPHVTTQPVQLLAEAIARDWARPHDDATIIIGRQVGDET
jgi:serine phosphatase RsbU (regulator of sigma subunit)